MNKHSVKVPRLYKVSAQVAKEVSEGIGSIKNLVYEKQKKHPNIKAMYALVATLFQKSDEIELLLKKSQLLIKESRFEPWLAKVLIVELLWGKKKLPGQSRPENTIRAYEQIFKAHISDETSKEITPKESKPRYVRVNTILSNLNEVVDGFREDGWTLIKHLDKTDYNGYLEKIDNLNNEEFMIDIHVQNLLVFPSKTTFYNHPAYKNGSILLQDKASCLPVHILGPPVGSTVLDMCAAPGMKTTHLAAILNNKGTVYATERNPKRFETLLKMVENAGGKCIQAFNKDVLECKSEDFPGVEYILVDPSCSGTGMTDRPDENEITQARLTNLTGFQIKILRLALTKFPDAKKVVYSTCSILPEENEDVVRQVLETNYNFKLVPAKEFVADTWRNFGSSDFGDIGKFCLYAKPNEDHTNGFFVAVFKRLEEGEENQFFNTRIFNFKKHVQANEKWKEKKVKKFKTAQANNNEYRMNEINTEESSIKETKKMIEEPKEFIEKLKNNKIKEILAEDMNFQKKKRKKDKIHENFEEDFIGEKLFDDNVTKSKKKKKNKYDNEKIDDSNNYEENKVIKIEKLENTIKEIIDEEVNFEMKIRKKNKLTEDFEGEIIGQIKKSKKKKKNKFQDEPLEENKIIMNENNKMKEVKVEEDNELKKRKKNKSNKKNHEKCIEEKLEDISKQKNNDNYFQEHKVIRKEKNNKIKEVIAEEDNFEMKKRKKNKTKQNREGEFISEKLEDDSNTKKIKKNKLKELVHKEEKQKNTEEMEDAGIKEKKKKKKKLGEIIENQMSEDISSKRHKKTKNIERCIENEPY